MHACTTRGGDDKEWESALGGELCGACHLLPHHGAHRAAHEEEVHDHQGDLNAADGGGAADGGVALARCLPGGGGSLWVRLGVGEDDRVEGDEARVEFAEGALVHELGDPLAGGYAEVVPARCADTVALLQALLKEELGAPGAAEP